MKCTVLPLVLAALCLTGCISTASIKNLPQAAADVNFEELAKRDPRVDAAWNQQTTYEDFRVAQAGSAAELHAALETALTRTGHAIARSDAAKRVVLGERGLRANEWATVTGGYYLASNGAYHIYIRSDITQDVTGGWREQRAKVVGDELCKELKCVAR